MKFKIRDEVLVKARIIEECMGIYGLKTQNDIVFNAKKESLIPVPDMTAEEAWDLARKIEGMRSDVLLEIFNMDSCYCILQDITPQEAKSKIETWEAWNEINVGDEVGFDDTANDIHRSMYVTSKYNDTDYCGICRNGDTYCVHKSALKKTGRHIDIKGLLKQIGLNEKVNGESPTNEILLEEVKEKECEQLAELLKELKKYQKYGTPDGYRSALKAYDDCYFEKEEISNELQEYKQLGTLEEVRDAVEKQKEERPIAVLGTFGGEEHECRECGNTVEYMDEYCKWCGKKLDWSEEE